MKRYIAAGSIVVASAILAGNGSQALASAARFLQVSAGYVHVCGIETTHRVVCWGDKQYGKSHPPAGLFLQVSAGGNHTCALRTNRAVVCWGSNSNGQARPPAG